jgi:hypothetical protein
MTTVPRDLDAAIRAIAARKGLTASDVLRIALEDFLLRNG